LSLGKESPEKQFMLLVLLEETCFIEMKSY